MVVVQQVYLLTEGKTAHYFMDQVHPNFRHTLVVSTSSPIDSKPLCVIGEFCCFLTFRKIVFCW